MKNYFCLVTFIILLILSNCSNPKTNNDNNNNRITSSCTASIIYYPVIDTRPIIIYTARKNKESLQFTVLNKEHLNTFKAKKENTLYDQENKEEKWYTDRPSTSKDMYNRCKLLHDELNTANTIQKYPKSMVIPSSVVEIQKRGDEMHIINAKTTTPIVSTANALDESDVFVSFLKIKEKIKDLNEQEKDLTELDQRIDNTI